MAGRKALGLLRIFALGSVVGVFGTIVVGGYVSATGAGLACPDWPLCGGAVFPDLGDPNVAAEWTHRLFAIATGVFVLATLVVALLWFRGNRRILFLGALGLGLVVPQVLLGMLAVTTQLNPAVVTIHLAIATATFGSTLALAILSYMTAPPQRGGKPVPG